MENTVTTEERALASLSYLPRGVREEIFHLCRGRADGLSQIREIRVRCGMRCSIIYKNEYIPLGCTVSREELDDTLYKLCEGSLYAHRENIASGYIPLPFGVRVGVCGFARYEGGGIVGVSEALGLVFRIPGHECAFAEELFAVWESGVGSGMLIYSPPALGKTTALRSLARHIGSGRYPRRVVVVDERCEFTREDYRGCEVDILRGYKKRQGIEIAVRTLSPEVLMVDELSGEDAAAVPEVARCGIPIIATAHAGSLSELSARGAAYSLTESGLFEVYVGISKRGGGYSLSIERSGEF